MHIKQRSGATTIKEGNFVLYLFMALSAKLWLFTRVNRRMEMIKNHCVRKVSSIDKRIFSSLTFIFVKKKIPIYEIITKHQDSLISHVA